jgi:hypothetical protein
MAAAAEPLHRLADYLDQHGRAHRASQIPPAEFWSAAAAHAAPGDQATLGRAAHDRGLYRDAAQLHKNAATSGDPHALSYLSRPSGCLPVDPRLARWAVAHADLDNPNAVANLLRSLWEAGAAEQATALLARDPAAHASLDKPIAVAYLLARLQASGADEQATALARRAAAHAPLDNPAAVVYLLALLQAAGADEQAAALLARDPAAHADLDNPNAVANLLGSLWEAGAAEQATALLARNPAAHASLDNPGAVASLLGTLLLVGAAEQATALLARDPAAHAPLDNLAAVASLLDALEATGADEQATALADRLPAAGMFGLFLEQKGLADQFRFGREVDGTPAAPWGWDDLDLWLSPTAGSLRRPCPSADRRPPNSRGKSGQFPVRTSGATLRSPAQRSGSSQSLVGQDTFCPVSPKAANVRLSLDPPRKFCCSS